MCVHTVQLYLVAFHMGLMCEHAQFPKRMWTVDTPNLYILIRVSKTCNLPTPNQLQLPSRLFFQPHIKLFLKLNYPQVTKQIKSIRFRPFKKYLNKIRLKPLQIVTN